MSGWLKGLVFIILVSEVLQTVFQEVDSEEKLEEYTRLGIAMYMLLFFSSFFHE